MGLDLILLVVTTALSSLSASGKIPATIATLVSSLAPIIGNAIKAIQGGQGKVQDAVTALGALSGVIAVLKSQTNLPADVLAELDVYNTAVQAGITGYLDSKTGIDLSKLGTVDPIA